MSKFANSAEAIDSSLLLWSGIKPTNTSVKEVYSILVYPSNSIDQTAGSTILLNIPPQETGLLTDVELVTKFKVLKGDNRNIAADEQVSTVSNVASAMFSLVDVRVDERVSFLQQMSHSYDLCTFFETMLNNNADRSDILFAREMFVTDNGTKAQSDAAHFFPGEHHTVVNKGGTMRAQRIALSKSVTVMSKLNVPFLNQRKSIIPNTKITVTLTRAKNSYCLIGAAGTEHKIVIEDVYLKCSYIKPEDSLLKVLNSKLERSPVVYEVDKQVILARMLPQGSQHHTINNLFEHSLPKFVLFAVQETSAINGQVDKNVHTFLNIQSLQLYVNNRPYFPKALENVPDGTDWKHNAQQLLDNLYKSVGKDHHGSMLINSENINLYQFYTLCLTDDRTYGSHYALKQAADTRLEIDLGAASDTNLVLIAYCLYDQQISIDSNRNVKVTE